MEAAKAAAPPATKVVAVTVLTSLDGDDLALDRRRARRRREQVERLTELAREAGHRRHRLLGRGSEGRACRLARRLFRGSGGPPDGRRLSSTRSASSRPRQAIDDGASILVIGRPITGSRALRTARRWTARVAEAVEGKQMSRMSWLSRVRSGIPFLPKRQSAENLWHKCGKCETMIFTKEWEDNFSVCPRCDYPRPHRPGEAVRADFRRRQI